MKTLGIALALISSIASCEKAGPKPSGDLSSSESDLLAYMPRDSDFAFGGNFMKLQDLFKKGPLAKFMSQADSIAPGMSKWTECFTSQEQLVMVGAVDAKHGMPQMRFIMKGLDIGDLEKCASSAGFVSKVDSDHKYISITMKGLITQTTGYLLVSDGLTYGKQTVAGGLSGGSLDRKDLEADIAAASKDNLLANKSLIALVEKTDRSRSMWFAGSAEGTDFADKLGSVYGAADIDDGFAIDIVAELKSESLAKEIVEGVDQAKSAAGMFAPEMKDILDELKLDRTGSRIRARIKLSNKQLEEAMSFGKGGGRSRPQKFDF